MMQIGMFLKRLTVVVFCAGAVGLSPNVGEAAPDSFAPLVEEVTPAVVNITTRSEIKVPDDSPLRRVPEDMFPPGSPFSDLFREFQNPTPRPQRALGSGFIISADGFVVTNNHVIDGADEVMVELFSGEKLEATVVGTDENTDLALLKVTYADGDLPFVAFGDSAAARVGDWVMAVGNPLGQGFSVSAGIISAQSRALSGAFDDYIQTDAAINRGNSGGPLFNMDGDVIGVNTAILSPTGGSIGIGFAMSSNVASGVIGQLMEYGETRRGWLGVSIQDLTPDMAEALGFEQGEGVFVAGVFDGPARDAGIQSGDVIINFDGQKVSDRRELVRAVGGTSVGKEARVVVFRDGRTQTVNVTLARREEAQTVVMNEEINETPSQTQEPVERMVSGMLLRNLDQDTRDYFNIDEDVTGVLINRVAPRTGAEEKGVLRGDILVSVDGQDVESVSQAEELFAAAAESGKNFVLARVMRDDALIFLALPSNEVTVD
jgi:serine protease Do